MPLTPEERRNDIAALRALDPRKWADTIRHHQQELRKEQEQK
ncbi:hypothetical protein JOF45_000398 [Nesterenkonia lacusekhoensis]|uniref:Uncharacterized protein n=1 Tax=Nesterenkonia lacusekhoensis TaxID=150832 RepID=A0ABS4T050_9MICC|nr:hypothetical protein [Nesterenkonia lacusekhoensis]